MTMNPLPPQAYTKDTLLKAYDWLMRQSPPIKEMATTPDILVSLFLKASRDGEGSLERPSILNFKKELKNLAGIMDDLEKPNTTPAPPLKMDSHPLQKTSLKEVAPAQSFAKPLGTPTLEALPLDTKVASAPMSTDKIHQLDSASLLMIQEVKEELNLSSQSEALRLLIKIGHTKIKPVLT